MHHFSAQLRRSKQSGYGEISGSLTGTADAVWDWFMGMLCIAGTWDAKLVDSDGALLRSETIIVTHHENGATTRERLSA